MTNCKLLVAAASALLVSHANHSPAAGLAVEVVELPAFRVNGQPARAHTQGLEVVEGKYYVTARREDVRPKRALLVRTETAGTNWDVWDITPVPLAGAISALDHPGGMQSDGQRLWIPIAESKPKSHSIIRVFPLAGIVPGQLLKPEFEFPVNDHIGAVAVAADRRLVLGANWDTEAVYVWDLQGHLKQTLTGFSRTTRGLGSDSPSGVAIQDWKIIGPRLYASGLCRSPAAPDASTRSRWLSFTNFLQPDFQRAAVALPLHDRTEMAREAMAISDTWVHFLPEDLGPSNRLFRVPIKDLLKRATAR
jgi:hypothetical protein